MHTIVVTLFQGEIKEEKATLSAAYQIVQQCIRHSHILKHTYKKKGSSITILVVKMLSTF